MKNRLVLARERLNRLSTDMKARVEAVGPEPGPDAPPGARAAWGMARMRAAGDPLQLAFDPDHRVTCARLCLERYRRGELRKNGVSNLPTYLVYVDEAEVLVEEWPDDNEDKIWILKGVAALQAEPEWTVDPAARGTELDPS